MTDLTPHLERFESYAQACREFHGLIPERFNIAAAICRRHPDAVTRVALHEAKEAGANTYTFGGLDFLSDKFATALSESGVYPDDRVAVMLPQSAALAVAHLGALKAGAVVVPLPVTADDAWIERALTCCGAKIVVVDESVAERTRFRLQALASCFVVRDLRPSAQSSTLKDFWTEVNRASSDFEAAETEARSPAFIFLVGSTGELAGVVHSHASVIGQLAAFEMWNNLEVDKDSVFWTGYDWSSINLFGMLYPAWWYGCSVVASASQNHLDELSLVEQREITHVFTSSSHLKALLESQHRGRFVLKLRTIATDFALSPELIERATATLGATISEVYGRPETGLIAGTCERWFASQPGAAGRVVPGRSVEIVDDSGGVVRPNHTSHVAVQESDPSLFIGYHNDFAKTDSAFVGDWYLTGDFGYKNEDGDLYILPSPPARRTIKNYNGC